MRRRVVENDAPKYFSHLQSQNLRLDSALSLSERTIFFKGYDFESPKFDILLAEDTFRSWIREPAFKEDSDAFHKRLVVDGLNENSLKKILGISLDDSRMGSTLEWVQVCTTAIQSYFDSADLQDDSSYDIGFLRLVEPLIKQFKVQLGHDLDPSVLPRQNNEANLVPVELAMSAFEQTLSERLISIITRTLVLELNVSRLRNELSGVDSNERFDDFVSRLKDDQIMLSIFREYPVLLRQATICTMLCKDAYQELFERLREDWDEIWETFYCDISPTMLEQVEMGVGDLHNGGRSVCILTFKGGHKLVYKPRPLAVDENFQRLLEWINDTGWGLDFRTIKVVSKNTYGWAEFVEPDNCTSYEGIKRFYQRQGGYLALFRMLNATDFHYENIIAAGEQPIFVDLESLLSPQKVVGDNVQYQNLSSFIQNSVLRLGLLPQKIWNNSDQPQGIDISGLGGTEGQMIPHSVPRIDKEATDEMHFVRTHVSLPETHNRPKTIDDNSISAIDYTNDLLSGFTRMYELLTEHKDYLLSSSSPIESFGDNTIRYIARPTRFYAIRLYESYHPDFLRSGLDKDRFFEQLWIDMIDKPHARLITAEREDMWRGDIPVFTTYPNSCDLYTSQGTQIKNFFSCSGYDSVREQIQSLSEEDMERQLWLIKSSLLTLIMGDEKLQTPPYRILIRTKEAGQSEFLEESEKVAERLLTLALRDQDSVTWMGISLVEDKHWTLQGLSLDLYNGISGIALFLGYLGYITKENKYTELARVITNNISKSLMQWREEQKEEFKPWPIGGFGEISGALYTLTHLCALWDDGDLWIQAEQLVDDLASMIKYDKEYDIVTGSAGCIAVLLGYHQLTGSQQALEAAVVAGDHLISCSKLTQTKVGVGWPSKMSNQPLTGFSHGVAGIAWALMWLASATSNSLYESAAESALEYERSMYDPEKLNWPDLRNSLGLEETSDDMLAPDYMMMWCHGAPGIALARVSTPGFLRDSAMIDEANVAVTSTLKLGFGLSHSLCHGDLGNAEILYEVGLALNDKVLTSKSIRMASGVIDSVHKDGWLCGTPLHVETPGLMTGLAGIGFGFLRFAFPERIPCILKMSPPPRDYIRRKLNESQ